MGISRGVPSEISSGICESKLRKIMVYIRRMGSSINQANKTYQKQLPAEHLREVRSKHGQCFRFSHLLFPFHYVSAPCQSKKTHLSIELPGHWHTPVDDPENILISTRICQVKTRLPLLEDWAKAGYQAGTTFTHVWVFISLRALSIFEGKTHLSGLSSEELHVVLPEVYYCTYSDLIAESLISVSEPSRAGGSDCPTATSRSSTTSAILDCRGGLPGKYSMATE